MVAESVTAKIIKIGQVVFELLPFYHITLWSAFVSITKNEHEETTYSESMSNAVTALSHYSVACTFVVTYQDKCLTFRSRSRSKVKMTFEVIK